ncbi:MAG: S1C family serine protease, partial [Acidobacteria bacterium]|nr:S1C family serine protease [Acidobacteriota bacterium]
MRGHNSWRPTGWRSRLRLLLWLVPLFLSPNSLAQRTTPKGTPTLTAEEVCARVSPSVFLVEVLDSNDAVVSSGSGVVTRPGYVVANKHVLERGSRFRVSQADASRPVRLSQCDAKYDSCLLRVEGLQAPPVEIRQSAPLEVDTGIRQLLSPHTPTQAVSDKAAPALTPHEVFKRVSSSVFVVEAIGANGDVVAFGSGVAIKAGELVTNTHVIEEGLRLRVRRAEMSWPATVTHVDAVHDLCKLKVEGMRASTVKLRPSTELQVGDIVFAVGAPEGLELTLSGGLVSGLRPYGMVRLIQTTAA